MFPLSNFFEDVDTLDSDKLRNWFAEDVVIRFGNSPEVAGKDNAADAISGFTRNFEKMRHEFVESIESDGKVYLESLVSYTLRGGRVITLPAATSITYKHSNITALKVFIDTNPLFSA